MALPTRFFIVEASDRPALPGDVDQLTDLVQGYKDWTFDALNGWTYFPSSVELITSPYTIAELAEDPTPRISESIALVKGDQGLFTPQTATIAIVVGELLGIHFAARAVDRYCGYGKCGETLLIAMRGDPAPDYIPQFWKDHWPNMPIGAGLHEMIHAWGVDGHHGGIMTNPWDYPLTTIVPEDQATLRDSPFLDSLPFPFWTINNITITDGVGCYTTSFDTDVLTIIEMVVSQKVPVSRRHYKTQRGVRVFCYYTWKLVDVTIVQYDSLVLTHHHEFTYCTPNLTDPIYFYFRQRFQPEKKSTKTPIMSALKGPVTCWWEAFPGPGFDLPWTNTSSPGMPPPTPAGGLLTLYAPKPNWRHEIQLLASAIPPLQNLPMNDLYLTIVAVASSVGGKLARTYCKATYWNPTTGQGTYRTIYFAHETQDCSGNDPLWWDPGIGAWRAPNAFSNRNLGQLYNNPPDFCWPVYQIPMTNLLSLRLGAQSSGWGDASITFTTLGICYQDPTMTHPPYVPTRPG